MLLAYLGTGGEHDVLGRDGLLAALREVNGDGCRAREPPVALHVVHLVLLQQHLDATCQLRHRRGLGGHHLREVQRHVVHVDPARREVRLGLVVQVAIVEEGLGWDAAHVEAGAAEGAAALDAHRLQPQLGCLDGRHVPAPGQQQPQYNSALTGSARLGPSEIKEHDGGTKP